jgi:hypothetical protein
MKHRDQPLARELPLTWCIMIALPGTSNHHLGWVASAFWLTLPPRINEAVRRAFRQGCIEAARETFIRTRPNVLGANARHGRERCARLRCAECGRWVCLSSPPLERQTTRDVQRLGRRWYSDAHRYPVQ